MRQRQPSVGSLLGPGLLAGLGGTAVMTAFQRLVEMPLTGRSDSYAPAEFAQRVSGLRPRSAQGRDRLNAATHVALGTLWGVGTAVAASRGLRGQRAVHAVFGVVYTSDVLLNTVLGLYRPTQWSVRDLAIDVVDKYVAAQATVAVFDRLVDR